MRLRLEDIQAQGQSLVLGSGPDAVEHKLRAYDLGVQLKCDRGFEPMAGFGGGLPVLHERLKSNDLMAFLKVAFFMLEDTKPFEGRKDENGVELEPVTAFIQDLTKYNVPAEVVQLLVTKALTDGQPVLTGTVKKKVMLALSLTGWIMALSTIFWHLVTRGCH